MNVRPLVPDTLERLAQREITPREAIRELMVEGYDEYLAWEAVGMAFGAGCIVQVMEDGRERYDGPGGRLVKEVARDIRNRNRARSRAQRIDVVSYSGEAPERICSFWSSRSWGLTCDDAEFFARLTAEGIATAPAGEIAFPRDGRRFFDALPAHFSGSYLRAHRATGQSSAALPSTPI